MFLGYLLDREKRTKRHGGGIRTQDSKQRKRMAKKKLDCQGDKVAHHPTDTYRFQVAPSSMRGCSRKGIRPNFCAISKM